MIVYRQTVAYRAFLALLLAGKGLLGPALPVSGRRDDAPPRRVQSFAMARASGQVNGLPDWENGFIPGVTGTVYAVLAVGNQVYIGGDFSQAGGIEMHK